MQLFLCRGCGRHVKECSAACPFCGADVATTPCLDGDRVVPRMSRGALLAGVGVAVAASVVSCGGSYGQCPMQVELTSPCGFSLIETTCLGGLPTCVRTSDGGPFTACAVVPATTKCAISVVLGDGTTHEVAVTADKCVEPAFVDFSSTTCTAPIVDAGFSLDVETDGD